MTIKELRKITGLSQEMFSMKYGIPRRTLEDWESGKRTPPDYVKDMLKLIITRLEGDSYIMETSRETEHDQCVGLTEYDINIGIDSDFTDVAEDILEVVNEYLYNVAIKIKTDKGFKIRKPVVKFQITRK